MYGDRPLRRCLRDTHLHMARLDSRPHTAEYDPPAPRHRPLGVTLSQPWAVLAVALPAIVLLGLNLSAFDLAYHVRAGNIMLNTHHVIRTDTCSFTAFGRPWLDQQWGAQIVLAFLYRLGGWPFLVFVRAVAGALVLLLVFLSCRARGATLKQAAALPLGYGAVALAGLMPRPQIFGLMLFALTVWILAGREQRPG